VPVSNSDEQLLSVLEALEACRAALRDNGNGDTAQLVSLAILDLRLKLNRVTDDELKALCDEMVVLSEERAREGQSRRRPLLRVVK
jgi:hypothetical protein